MAAGNKKAEPLSAAKTEEAGKTAETAVTAVKPAAKAKKPAAKKPVVKKAAAPKAVKTKVYVEYQGRQVLEEDLVAAVKADWSGEAVKSLELYVKPEDGAVYYVVNGKGTGRVPF